MLKIGTLRWKGRCSKHPRYDPSEGEGAVRGGCTRCYRLLDIHRQHRLLLQMMREFGPAREGVKRKVRMEGSQLGLFD